MAWLPLSNIRIGLNDRRPQLESILINYETGYPACGEGLFRSRECFRLEDASTLKRNKRRILPTDKASQRLIAEQAVTAFKTIAPMHINLDRVGVRNFAAMAPGLLLAQLSLSWFGFPI